MRRGDRERGRCVFSHWFKRSESARLVCSGPLKAMLKSQSSQKREIHSQTGGKRPLHARVVARYFVHFCCLRPRCRRVWGMGGDGQVGIFLVSPTYPYVHGDASLPSQPREGKRWPMFHCQPPLICGKGNIQGANQQTASVPGTEIDPFRHAHWPLADGTKAGCRSQHVAPWPHGPMGAGSRAPQRTAWGHGAGGIGTNSPFHN